MYISSVHVIIYKNVVPARLQNISGLMMCLLRIFAKFASGWRPTGCKFNSARCKFKSAGCKFHLVSRQPDANFIRSAASWMQLHTASGYPIQNTQIYQLNEICIRLADSRMQILQK
jgi:hypothetical protein